MEEESPDPPARPPSPAHRSVLQARMCAALAEAAGAA